MWLLNHPESYQPFVQCPDAFSAEELDRVSTLESTLEMTPAKLGDANVDSGDVRDSTVGWVPEDEEHAWIYRRLTDVVNSVNSLHFHLDLRGIEQLQLTRYGTDGHYGAHIDSCWDGTRAVFRKLSFSIQLSHPEEYDGGELLLYPNGLQPLQSPKERGWMTAFRSNIIHEVVPVTRGTRLSLVGWVQGPLLK